MAKAKIYQKWDHEKQVPVWQGTQRSGKDAFRAEDRDGIRAADWEKETSSRKELSDDPQVDKPGILIESAVVIGADKLTAQDIALHEYLLACGRKQGIGKGVHEISLAQLGEYLNITSKKRLWTSLERLMATTIRYSVIDRFTNKRVQEPMVSRVAISTNRLSGKTVFQFSIPAFVRFAMLKSRSCAWLDINVFARLTSKYASRLYPKLALIAGYDERLRKPWTPTVRELAVFLGYAGPSEDFHVGSFLRTVDKAVEEIKNEVTRFDVAFARPVRGKGRGRPVEGKFLFRMSDAGRDLYAYQELKLDPQSIARINDRRYTPLEENEHPSPRMFSQAWQMTGVDASDLSDRWRSNISLARRMPGKMFGAMSGAMLSAALDERGLLVAFKMWVKMVVMLDGVEGFGPPSPPSAAELEQRDFERSVTVEISGGSGGNYPDDDDMFGSDEISDDHDDLRSPEQFDRYYFEEEGPIVSGIDTADEDIPY